MILKHIGLLIDINKKKEHINIKKIKHPLLRKKEHIFKKREYKKKMTSVPGFIRIVTADGHEFVADEKVLDQCDVLKKMVATESFEEGTTRVEPIYHYLIRSYYLYINFLILRR